MEAHRDQIQEYEDLADELGHPPGDVALAWLLAQPAVTAPIIGPRTQEQLDAALRALDVELDDKTLDPAGRDLPGSPDRPRGLRLVTGSAVRVADVSEARTVAELLDAFNAEYGSPTPGPTVLTARLERPAGRRPGGRPVGRAIPPWGWP